MTARDQLSPDEATLDDLLHALTPEHAPGEAPQWADQLGGWLVVAVVEWPKASPSDLEGIGRLCDVVERAGDGRWLLAQHAPAGLSDDPRAQMLVRVLRRTVIASGGARVALAAAPGWPGNTMLIGPAPENAAALYRKICASGRTGLFIDDTLHQYLSEPAVAFGDAFRLAGGARRISSKRGLQLTSANTGRVVALMALAAALFIGLRLYGRLEPPDGAIYFHTQPAVERGHTLHAGDPLTVQLEGEAQSFGTVLLLDSADQWQLPAADGVNHRFTSMRPQWQARFALDGQPGRERFFGIITPEPLPNPTALLRALNASDGPRSEATSRLSATLETLEINRARVLATTEIEHQR